MLDLNFDTFVQNTGRSRSSNGTFLLQYSFFLEAPLYKKRLELNDKLDEVLEDIRKTVEVDNEKIVSNSEEDDEVEQEDEEVVDQPLFIPAMSAGPELETATQQSGSIPLENVTSIPSTQPPFVQSNSFQELTPEFQEKKIKSLEDRFKCHLQEKINILKVKTIFVQNQEHTRDQWTLGPILILLI